MADPNWDVYLQEEVETPPPESAPPLSPWDAYLEPTTAEMDLPENPFAPVENTLDNLDDDRDPSVGEFLHQFMATSQGLDPRAPDTPTLGEMLTLAPGLSFAETQEGVIAGGQATQEWLRKPSLTGNFEGRFLSQAFDVAGQVASGPLEMFAGIFPDESYSPTFNVARTIREATRVPETAETGFVEDYFVRPLLQTGAFMFGGKAAQVMMKETPKMAAAIAAWLGAGVGGQAGREDALRHGATEDQVAMAAAVNSMAGTSEGLPIGVMLNRLDDATGGFFARRFKHWITKGIAGGVESAVEEALQETFQTYAENWTASDWAKYDPTRPLNENIMAAASTGGGIGFLLGMTTTAIGGRSRAARDREVKEKILDPLGAASLDEIAGPVSVLEERLGMLEESPEYQEYLAALEERGEIDSELTVRMQAEQAKAEGVLASDPGPTLLSALEVNRRNLSDSADMIQRAARWSENPAWIESVLTGTPSSEVHGDISYPIPELVGQTQVVIAVSREQLENGPRLEELRKDIADLESRAELSDATNLEKIALEELRLKEKGMVAAQEASSNAAKDLKTLMDNLLPILGKHSTILVNDTSLEARNDPADGQYGLLEVGPEALLTNVILLRTEGMTTAAASYAMSPTEANKAILDRETAAVLTTATHEFGHAVAHNELASLYRKGLNGQATESEKKLFNAIRNDYFQFVIDNLNAPLNTAVAAGKTISRYAREYQKTLTETAALVPDARDVTAADVWSRDSVNYLFGVQEYLAEQTAKIGLEQTNLVDSKTLPFFRGAVKATNEALSIAKAQFGSQAPTLAAFYKSHGIRQQIKSLSQIVGERSKQDPMHAIFKEGLLTKEQADRLLGEGDTFNWFMDKGFNILQIAEQNPHLQGLQDYTEHLREWKNEVNNTLALAEHTLTKWKNLGKKESELLGRVLLDESVGRNFKGGWKETPKFFTKEELAEYKLSDEALELREEIQNSLLTSLNEMEAVLIAAKKRIFTSDIIEQTREVNKVKKEFSDMRSRPYHPLMRFGDYILQVRSQGEQRIDGRDYKGGQLVDYQTFDTKPERDKARTLAKRQYSPNQTTVSVSHRVTPNFSLQGMPMTLLEHLESKLTSAEHSEEVSKSIKEAMQELKNDALPFRSFRKQFQRRKRVEGYSMDAQRSFANYMTSFSNHIARVKFDHLFKEDFDNVQNSIDGINRREGGDSTKRAKILNHMNDHMNYVMNPVNEFVFIRSAAFLWFLGFNVKSAFVNLTQVPLVTYPYLAARYGDGKAVAEITRAYGAAVKSMTTKNKGGDFMTEEEIDLQGMINRGLSESWLDESLATELALAASEKNLDKTLPRKLRQKAWLKISHYGSLPFHVAEKLNRHITAIAAYRLARAAGRSHEGGVREARHAVEKTQFEYARWARPKFMRGKVGGTVFVFQNYMQNALYFALGGDPGALRMVVMLFMLSGVMGIPFAENIADLVDAAMTTLKRRAGMKNPHTQIRVDARELLNDLDVNPDLILHGMSSSTFGLANVGEFMGWPIPDLDLSGSLSMGRILPGTQLVQPGYPRTVESTVKGTLEFGAGAIGSAGIGVLSGALNDHPDTWKAWEKAMPAAMRQISKAARVYARGKESTRSGTPIAGFDMHDTKDQGELIGQSLGFTPRSISKGWEGFIAQQQAVIYYKTWATGLLRQWNYAKETGDKEAEKETNVEIREYNSIVPFPEMRIGFETRQDSFESYRRTRALNARKIEQSKAYRRLSTSIGAVFEEGDNEGT